MEKREIKTRKDQGKIKSANTPAALNEVHKKEAFLRAYRKLGGKYTAAESIGVAPSTIWRWEKDDEKFRNDILDVEELDTEELEAKARERAVEKSDLLTMFLLKKRKPEYRDNSSLEISGKGGGPIEVSVINYAGAAKNKGKEGSA